MALFSHLTELNIAATALDLATLVVLGIVTILQCCFVRRHNDPARAWVHWVRWSTSIFDFTLFLICADLVIRTVYNRFIERGIEFFPAEQRGLIQAMGILESIWQLAEAVVRVLLLVTLATLSAGIAMARTSGHAPVGWTRLRPASVFAGGVTLVVAVAVFGVRCYYWAHVFDKGEPSIYRRRYQSPPGSIPNLDEINRVTVRMDLALHCIWILLALVVLTMGVRTRGLSRAAPHTSSASKLFLACAVLFVAQPLYCAIIVIIFSLGIDNVQGGQNTIITDVFFRVWPYAAILLVLFVLGGKKAGGVYSTEQAFVTKQGESAGGAPMHQTAWGYQVPLDARAATQTRQPGNYGGGDSQAQLNSYYAQAYHGQSQQPQRQHQQLHQQHQPHYG